MISTKTNIKNKALKKRIIELSYKYGLSHLSSCLTAIDILVDIFEQKKPADLVVLSQGHAGLALYVALEHYEKKDAEKMLAHHGIHPDRCSACGLHCTAGSLGHGLGIAAGMALAEPDKTVHCIISDGEAFEGSIYEALNLIRKLKLSNIKIYYNANGWSGYDRVDSLKQWDQLHSFGVPIALRGNNVDYLPFLSGLDGHYHVMTEAEYRLALEILR